MMRGFWLAGVALLGMTLAASGQEKIAPPKSVQSTADVYQGKPVQTVVPYTHSCQDQKFAKNPLGRLGAWLTYRPLFSGTPCECDGPMCCAPPAYTFFSPSRYNRCYEPYHCKSCNDGCSGWSLRGLFGGWGRSDCGNGPTTICITLPKISFSRGGCDPCVEDSACSGGKCGTGLGGGCGKAACNPCKDRCLPLPGPIPERAGLGLLRGNAACGCGAGACGLGGRLLGSCNNRTCAHPTCHTVNLNKMPILPPSNVRSCDVGKLDQVAPVLPVAPEKVAEPMPK